MYGKLLKNYTKLDIPIILIAHTGKIPDDRVPSFRDIRDSSFITQEADVCMMMWRLKSKDAARRIDDDSDEDVYTNKAMLSVELNRSGTTGKIKLVHNGCMFEEDDGEPKIITNKKDNVCTNYPMI